MDVFFDWRWRHIRKIYYLGSILSDIKKEFDSDPVYNNCLKTKIKCHDYENSDFYFKRFSKLDSNHTFLTVINLDFSVKKDDNFYLQVFLKEFKCIEKKW